LFSDLDTIPIEESFGFDGLAVDGSAVAALEVSKDVGVTYQFDFGVFAGGFGVVEVDFAA
jgi:hypothetical protein